MNRNFKYQCSLMVDGKFDTIGKNYINHRMMKEWDSSLLSIEPDKENPKVYYLMFMIQDNEMHMKETLENDLLPEEISLIYEVPGAWNRCVNRFSPKDGKVLWEMDVEFQFQKDVMIPIEKFEEKTLVGMELYKNYVEARKNLNQAD